MLDYSKRYIRWLAKTEGISIEEAASRSLARVYSLFNNDKDTVVAISAFGHERNLQDNRELSKELAGKIRGLGWGSIKVIGGFAAENKKTGKQDVRVQEDSYIVSIPDTESRVSVMKKIYQLMDDYKQDSAVIKFAGDELKFVYLYERESKRLKKLGKWHADPKLLGTYFTRMRNGPPGRQYVIECAEDGTISTRRCVDLLKYY